MNLHLPDLGLRGPVEAMPQQSQVFAPGCNSAQAPEFPPPSSAAALTAEEEGLLAQCKATIQRGLEELGQALRMVRDRRLYRVSYDTFEGWCQAEFGWSARRARQICAAAEIVSALEAEAGERRGVFVIPANERQVRPLAALPAVDRLAAWDQAVATARGRPVTEKHVRAVVNAKLGKNGTEATEATEGTNGSAKAPRPGSEPAAVNGQAAGAVPGGVARAVMLVSTAEEVIAKVRELIDLAGTADSIHAVGLQIALQQVEGYKDHLANVSRLQRSRRRV